MSLSLQGLSTSEQLNRMAMSSSPIGGKIMSSYRQVPSWPLGQMGRVSGNFTRVTVRVVREVTVWRY